MPAQEEVSSSGWAKIAATELFIIYLVTVFLPEKLVELVFPLGVVVALYQQGQ